jgi:hypothetical protein
MANWSFLTSHARVLMCIAHDPGARLRDIAASLGITERSAQGIVADLAGPSTRSSRKMARNRYQMQAHLPLPEAASQEPAIRRSPRRRGRPPATLIGPVLHTPHPC